MSKEEEEEERQMREAERRWMEDAEREFGNHPKLLRDQEFWNEEEGNPSQIVDIQCMNMDIYGTRDGLMRTENGFMPVHRLSHETFWKPTSAERKHE